MKTSQSITSPSIRKATPPKMKQKSRVLVNHDNDPEVSKTSSKSPKKTKKGRIFQIVAENEPLIQSYESPKAEKKTKLSENSENVMPSLQMIKKSKTPKILSTFQSSEKIRQTLSPTKSQHEPQKKLVKTRKIKESKSPVSNNRSKSMKKSKVPVVKTKPSMRNKGHVSEKNSKRTMKASHTINPSMGSLVTEKQTNAPSMNTLTPSLVPSSSEVEPVPVSSTVIVSAPSSSNTPSYASGNPTETPSSDTLNHLIENPSMAPSIYLETPSLKYILAPSPSPSILPSPTPTPKPSPTPSLSTSLGPFGTLSPSSFASLSPSLTPSSSPAVAINSPNFPRPDPIIGNESEAVNGAPFIGLSFASVFAVLGTVFCFVAMRRKISNDKSSEKETSNIRIDEDEYSSDDDSSDGGDHYFDKDFSEDLVEIEVMFP